MFSYFEDPNVHVDVQGPPLGGRHDVLVVVVWEAVGALGEVGVGAVAHWHVAPRGDSGQDH